MPLPVRTTTDSAADHIADHNTLHAEYNTPTHTHPGSTGAPVLPLDVAPGTPHAKDDEFSGAALDAKWTNPLTSAAGQTNTITVANGWLSLEPATAGSAGTGKRVFGIRQEAPAGSFTVSAKISTSRAGALPAGANHGIFVARRTATAKAHTLGVQPSVAREVEYMGVTTYSETADWSDWDALEVNVVGEAWTPRWVRFTWDAAASTLYSYFSSNGVGWHFLASRAAMAQPEVIGLCIYERSALVGADMALHVDWFRVTEP